MEASSQPSSQSSVTQGLVPCLPFNTNLPVLRTPEGDFIPIRAVCTMLGLAPATWIGVVCQRYSYSSPAFGVRLRKLPWRTDEGGRRVDWCLAQQWVTHWLKDVHPKYIHDRERHAQLVAFQEQALEAVSGLYKRMQDEYAAAKRQVYADLQVCERSQHNLVKAQAFAHEHLPHMIDDPTELQATLATYDQLITRGNAVYDAYADALRRFLQGLLDNPVIDGYVVRDGEVVDTVAMPLLPVIPDRSEVDACRERLNAWVRNEFAAWYEAQGAEVTWERKNQDL